jgi:DNA-binding response OmpR family regulator
MKGNSKPHDDLQLTRKEQELLDLLEQNPGRCFSRSYLLRQIWGYSDDARTRTVDVHVSRLRKKIENRPEIAIHTVVRHGYVLERRSPDQSRDEARIGGPLGADDSPPPLSYAVVH